MELDARVATDTDTFQQIGGKAAVCQREAAARITVPTLPLFRAGITGTASQSLGPEATRR